MSWGWLEPEPQLPRPLGEPGFRLAVRGAGGSRGNPHTSIGGPPESAGPSLSCVAPALLCFSPHLALSATAAAKKSGKHLTPSMLSTSSASSSCWHGALGAASRGTCLAPHCPQSFFEPLKMLVIPGPSTLFPWSELRTSPVHVVPVPVPSALLLPGAVGAHLARVWQKRPKTKFVLCIQDPAYTEGLGRRWLCSPHG